MKKANTTLNILTLLGSPKRKGNTATVLAAFEQLAAENHTIERIDVVKQNIKGCIGCDNCQKDVHNPGCIIKDDFLSVVEKILAADVVVYAAPVYVWDFPAQMKALFDRQCCLSKWKEGKGRSLLQDKKTMLLVTCGDDAENNADLIQEIFRREMNYFKCNLLGTFAIGNCTLPAELGVIKDETAEKMYQVVG